MKNNIANIFCIFILTLFAGCAPKLIVHNLDHTYEQVAVQIDEKPVGTLEYGETLSKRLTPGPHHVLAHPQGETKCPWVESGDGWVIYLDEGAQLTLLPVSRKSGLKAKRERRVTKIQDTSNDSKPEAPSPPNPEADNPYGD